MRRWLETLGYVLCFRLARLNYDYGQPFGWLERLWAPIWYRYYCPYPIEGNGGWRASDCAKAGNCGCNNLDRYGTPEQIKAASEWKPIG